MTAASTLVRGHRRLRRARTRDDAFLADPGLTVKGHVTDARADALRKPLQDFVPRGLSRHDEGEVDNLHCAVFRKDVVPLVREKTYLGHLRFIESERGQNGALELGSRHNRNELSIDVDFVAL